MSSSSSEALANVKEDMSNSDDSEILAAHGLNTRGGAAVCVEDVRQTEANCKKCWLCFYKRQQDVRQVEFEGVHS